MEEQFLRVVRGRTVERVVAETVRRGVTVAERVIVDLGAGDGRWAYRRARRHPTWLYLALDANADGMRRVARRAARRPERGGAPNVWFVRAAAEALPPLLRGAADEVHVHLPWGSLLRAVVEPDPRILLGIAALCRQSATLCVRVNAALLDDPARRARLALPPPGKQSLETRLVAGYAAAGIHVSVTQRALDVETSWARRLGAGRPLSILALDGTVGRASSAPPVPAR
jgi:16S rRNA (adenine(1408)-N(1))-methyltransferase